MGGRPARAYEDIPLNAPQDIGWLCAHASPGTLVLFHGVTARSWLCEWFGWSEWSHIGVVLPPPPSLGSGITEPVFFECVGHRDGLACLRCRRSGPGPRLVTLRQRLEQYCSEGRAGSVRVCIIPLQAGDGQPIDYATGQKLGAALWEYAAAACHSTYQSNLIALAGATLGAPALTALSHLTTLDSPHSASDDAPVAKKPPAKMQCAELVAAALIHAGILHRDYDWADVVPRTFVTGRVRVSDYDAPGTLIYAPQQYHLDVYDPQRLATVSPVTSHIHNL